MDQLIDIVDKYPVRNQAVLYMTLHYADMALPVSVLRDWLLFDDDLYRLAEILSTKGSDEQIAPVVKLLGNDLKLLFKSYTRAVVDQEDCSTPRLSEEAMVSFAILRSMLGNILRELHTMKAEDISILLDDMDCVENNLFFNAIEAFSDKHLLAAGNFITADMKAFIEKNR